MKLPIADRRAAGAALAKALLRYRERSDVVVLALPRGGLPVAKEIADALGAALDILIVRKLGAPDNPELAVGAIASGGARVMNDEIVTALGVTQQQIDEVTAAEQAELDRRERAYRGDRPRPPLAGRCVVLVDDGVATGATMRAGVAALRALGVARIVVAVAVAPVRTVRELEQDVDEVVCLATPEPFWAVGQWYRDFRQISDAEVSELLAAAWQAPPATPSGTA